MELHVSEAESLAPPARGRGTQEDDELRSVAQLKMLHSLARRLNQLNDVQQIGEAITSELRTLIDYHNCRVHLLEEDGKTLLPIAFRGELSEYQGETFDALVLRVGEGVTGRVAQVGQSYYSPNTADDPYAVTIPGTPDVDESLLVVPLRYADRLIGTIALSKLGIDQFDQDDMRVLEVMASHAAVAIENARLLEGERLAALTSRELLQLSQTLTKVHDTDTVLAAAVKSIPSMIDCSGIVVYLRDNVTGSFQFVHTGEDGPEPSAIPLDVPAPIADQFFLFVDRPFVLPREVVATVPEPYRAETVLEVLVAPIRWDPDGLGAIVIGAATTDARFQQRDLDFARGIADITSLALGNAGRFRELQEAAERLQALDEMKNMFLDAVSHELRTPLSAVLGIALTLRREDVHLAPDDAKDLIERLATNARKLERLLSDLLDLDRLARGIVEPNRRPTDVAQLVGRIARDAEGLQDRPVTLELEPVTVAIDPAKVERIVENLLANTARHTSPGTEIWVRVAPHDGGVLIVVEDNGEGVPQPLREAVFEPFHQGPQRSPHSPGVGIGLSLVARFAELHGGRAWVEERPGGGASFRVFLPSSGPVPG